MNLPDTIMTYMNHKENDNQYCTAVELPFMTLRTTARSYGPLSVSTIKRWIGQGLPYHQAQGRGLILIKPADVDAFLQRKSVKKPDLTQLVEETLQELATKQNRKTVR